MHQHAEVLDNRNHRLQAFRSINPRSCIPIPNQNFIDEIYDSDGECMFFLKMTTKQKRNHKSNLLKQISNNSELMRLLLKNRSLPDSQIHKQCSALYSSLLDDNIRLTDECDSVSESESEPDKLIPPAKFSRNE